MPTADRWLPRLPSPLTIFAAALGGVLVGITVTKGVQDPDFWWHITTGNLIASNGSVPSTDPFSFTWHGQPWTPHEWLSELLMYWLVNGLGATAALFVWGLFPALIVAAQAAMLSRLGVGVRAFAGPAVLIGLVITPYVTLRPQAVSWLLLSVLIWGLLSLRPDRPARALWLVPFFIVWANLHGVYVIGLGVVATYTLFTLLGRTPMSSARGWMVGAALGTVAAGMLTPAGPIGLLYPLRYIDSGDWGLANIQEWQSPNFHEPAHWAFLGLIVAVGLNKGRSTPGWLIMLSWVGIALGLAALRNVPIAAVFCLPTLALGIQARLAHREATRPARPMRPERALGRRVMEIGAAIVVVVGAMVVLLPSGLGDNVEENIAEHFPVAAMDLLEGVDPDANVLADYGWGGYVINRLYPLGGHVFVDGRNDMYDQRILEDYEAIANADPGWDQLARGYGVNAILLRPEAPLTRGPAQYAGWCEAFRSETQVLYLPKCLIDVSLVSDGLVMPTGLVVPPDGSGRLFVVEQPGLVRILTDDGLQPDPFLDLTGEVALSAEQGLVGLAFHPDFASNGRLFVDYTNLDGDTVVTEYTTSDGRQVDPASARQLLFIDQPHELHNGGGLVFGPDGYLYIGVGDGGWPNNVIGTGQDTSTLFGSILRIDVDSRTAGLPYGIPSDNPFAADAGAAGSRAEIWDYGLRNPFRFTFDPASGDLYIADVGQVTYEEIDRHPATEPGGLNFGWSIAEGRHCFDADTCDMTGLIAPLVEYGGRRLHTGNCAIIGGPAIRGGDVTALNDQLVFGDYCSGRIWTLPLDDPDAAPREQADTHLSITGFAFDGIATYVLDYGGSVYRVVSADAPTAAQ